MKKIDVLVIGGGLSGLAAAAVAAKQGKKVQVLAYGAGTLTIGGGIIDVLGYADDGKPLAKPADGLSEVAADHPYAIIGRDSVEKAIAFFKGVCEEQGYPYKGDTEHMQWIPTAAGTLKPTCLVPYSMDADALPGAKRICVAGFDYLKDFYPHIVANNLQKLFPAKVVETAGVTVGFSGGRDVSALDVARWLDTEEGQRECIRQLQGKLVPGSLVIMPPVLGTRPDYKILERFTSELDCRIVESAALPPSVSGLRLRSMLLEYLKKHNVTIIEKAFVSGSIIEKGICKAVITRGIDRDRSYYAEQFILATGGLYGGGLQAEPGRIIEPVFQLPVEVPAEQEQWSNAQLFNGSKQPYAAFGIAVDESLRPVTAAGEVLLGNVRVAGRNLAGYDFCFEKSGNGVALASGYKAAMACEEERL